MGIWKYFLKRLLSVPPTILLVLLLIFVVFSTVGGGIASPYSTQFPAYSNTLLSFLHAYFLFVFNILTGQWGYLGALKDTPTFTGQLVSLVQQFFFSTLEVVLIAAPIALAISFPLGRYLGTLHTEKKAKILRGIVIVGYVTPAYITAVVLQVVLGQGAIQGNPLGVFPIVGAYNLLTMPVPLPGWLLSNGSVLLSHPTHMLFFDALINGNMKVASDAFMHLVLPVVTLVISITGVVTFLLESGYTDNMGMEYVRGARSKGLPENYIIKRHVRKNAVLPVMASATIMVAYLLSNIIMMEYVFTFPGIGLFLITTILYGQYYPTAVIIFLLSLIVITIGIIIDVVNYAKNPLVRSS